MTAPAEPSQPRRVLMVVFQFPPFAGSSAVQRALRFVQHLPSFGWQPIVLTASASGYERVAVEAGQELPAGVHVERALALDAKRHFAWRGRYPAALARPDRWRAWQWTGRWCGRRLIRRFRPAALWSTYPILSAHEIACTLARESALPWLADFRDPVVEEAFPEDPVERADCARRELAYANVAAGFTVTTPSLRDWFVARYPQLGGRVTMIENGYDEPSFAGMQGSPPVAQRASYTLLHSGELYPVLRDPVHLFRAVRELQDGGALAPGELRFRFRAPGDEAIVRDAARAHGLEDVVEVAPRVSYGEALREMLAADALLILQGIDCNRQIPAKAYEYLRAGRHVLGITDPVGDTGRMLAGAGVDCIAALEDVAAIRAALLRLLPRLRAGAPAQYAPAVVEAGSRRARAGELARLLDATVAAGAR